jgi:metal-dependent hydrolase (beta-lactamase superfamily II)
MVNGNDTVCVRVGGMVSGGVENITAFATPQVVGCNGLLGANCLSPSTSPMLFIVVGCSHTGIDKIVTAASAINPRMQSQVIGLAIEDVDFA